MTQYIVVNDNTKYFEYFYNLKSAKQAMKENNASGFATKIYSNGDSVYLGEITLTGSNKQFVANSPGNMKNSNY